MQDGEDSLLQGASCAALLLLKVIDLSAAHEGQVTGYDEILALELLVDVEASEKCLVCCAQLRASAKGSFAATPILHVFGHKGS